MSFQLVRASDTDMAVWHTQHGHIYVFQVAASADALIPVLVRAAPDAAEPANGFAEDALRFATGEAEARRMIKPARGQSAGGEPVSAERPKALSRRP